MTRSATYRALLPATLLALLAGCGGVQIKPEPALPKALVNQMPARIGLVLPQDMRELHHKETRWGVGWDVDLGPGHVRLVRALFAAEFDDIVEFDDVESASRESGLKAIFEPRIEQYSFATARETGGRHYAVTIRYRINLYSPEGKAADSYTLTGYGSALARGMSSSGPLHQASLAAMRDAAAKFLVQFPEQPAAKRLAQNEPIVVEEAPASASAGPEEIDSVPIYEDGKVIGPPTDDPTSALPPQHQVGTRTGAR
jgi:hypothetical protein